MTMEMNKQPVCKKIDECYKVEMVLDKDFAGDWQYAQVIRDVCDKCQDRV